MSNFQNIFLLFIIFTTNCCQSSYIKQDEQTVTPPNPDDTQTTENIQNILNEIVKEDSEKVQEINEIFVETLSNPQSAETALNSDETKSIFTGEMFEIRLTIKHVWSDDFVDIKSKKFAELSKLIDTDLISFFDNQLNKENSIRRGSFVLKNVLPSSIDDFLYVTLVAESSDNVTGEIMYEKLENYLLIYDKFYEVEVLKDGFYFKGIKDEELEKFEKHLECDNEYCKSTPQPTQKPSNLLSQESETSEELPHELSSSSTTDECTPNEKFNRGSTAIYIFDNNHKCVENVKKRSLLSSSSQQCGQVSQSNENEVSNGSESDEDLAVSASENYPQTSNADDVKDDEVIVVVRKRGDKVFIEI